MNLPRRLLATDLDGTFLDSAGRVTPENREALKQAKNKGISVIFVTGRPARWLKGVADSADHYDLIIGANGGFIADMNSLQVTTTNAADPTELQIVANNVLALFPDAVFAIERSYVGMPIADSQAREYDEMRVSKLSEFEFAVTPGYVATWKIDAAIPVAPIDELLQLSDITKLIVKPGDPSSWNSDTWLSAIAPAVEDRLQLTHASQEIVLAEISAKGITKASALAQVAAAQGMSAHDVVAIGDMPNDVPMLEWAGEAWTVENAHPEVRAVTDNVLQHHDLSPVATLITDLMNRLD
jgi:Cof subfamily protein (haloacid dehalogenase superfamily)